MRNLRLPWFGPIVACGALTVACVAGDDSSTSKDDNLTGATSRATGGGKNDKPSKATPAPTGTAPKSPTTEAVDAGSEAGSDVGSDEVDASAESGSFCIPGAYVFCRCADREEGTKKCDADGDGFSECLCGGE